MPLECRGTPRRVRARDAPRPARRARRAMVVEKACRVRDLDEGPRAGSSPTPPFCARPRAPCSGARRPAARGRPSAARCRRRSITCAARCGSPRQPARAPTPANLALPGAHEPGDEGSEQTETALRRRPSQLTDRLAARARCSAQVSWRRRRRCGTTASPGSGGGVRCLPGSVHLRPNTADYTEWPLPRARLGGAPAGRRAMHATPEEGRGMQHSRKCLTQHAHVLAAGYETNVRWRSRISTIAGISGRVLARPRTDPFH
jgi:hypothetical protein